MISDEEDRVKITGNYYTIRYRGLASDLWKGKVVAINDWERWST